MNRPNNTNNCPVRSSIRFLTPPAHQSSMVEVTAHLALHVVGPRPRQGLTETQSSVEVRNNGLHFFDATTRIKPLQIIEQGVLERTTATTAEETLNPLLEFKIDRVLRRFGVGLLPLKGRPLMETADPLSEITADPRHQFRLEWRVSVSIVKLLDRVHGPFPSDEVAAAPNDRRKSKRQFVLFSPVR